MITKIIGNTEKKMAVDEDEINKIYNNLGTVETTDIATVQHLQGSYFINSSGQIVKATSTININDVISIGINCESTNILSVLNTLNSTLSNMVYTSRRMLTSFTSLESITKFNAENPFNLNNWVNYNYTDGYSRILVDYARSSYTINHPFSGSAFAATFILLDYWNLQIAYFYNFASSDAIYVRTIYNGTTSSWKRLAYLS